MTLLHTARNRFLFLVLSFIFWFSNFIYIPILSPYLETIGGDYTFIGLVLGSYGLMQFLFRLPFGIFSDLIKLRKPFIIFGMVVSTLSCVTFAWADSLGWILLARSLAGVAAATWVAFTILFSSYFSESDLHRAMGSISLAVVLAQLLGMAISGFIVDLWGWHAPFWIGGIIGFVGIVLSLFIYESNEDFQKEPIQLKELISVMLEPALLKVSFLSILAHGIIFTTMFGFTPAFALKLGLQTDEISMVIFSFMIPHAVATMLSGKIFVPLFGKWRLLKLAFGLTAIFTICTPIIDSKGMLFLFQGLNGFSLGTLFPLFLGMAVESIPLEKRATAMGAYQAIYAIGMFAGPFIAGVLISHLGISAGFYFAGSLGATAVFFMIFWSRLERKATKHNLKWN
ncbi:MFS transporter [Peribacillus simplex]|uniref:MFS transporter n=1 Tax=Peribacillus simplex TaxID=1478 RepID=UPI002E1E17DC|nr:MFS transporter [Peribacillus simplex]MED3984934.1 MFS transporter [Peribacillus simplex]MED4097192.1 MFS transporter [Peribacillus simplex]